MIAGLYSHCRGYYCLVALALLTPLPMVGGSYLPLVGPPPLRFELARNHGEHISWNPPVKPLPPVAVETNPPPVTSSSPNENIVAVPLATPVITAPSTIHTLVGTENLSTNSVIQTRSANDLLVVTPEMLVDYFKPNNNMTNAANVRVIAPVNFAPPASASIPSSQAIYKSQ